MNNRFPVLLVADDEPFNQEIIEEYLEDDDYTLITADDGAEAWEILEADPEKFDAVLLDRMMPGLEGIEVLTRIKAHPTLKNLPVIIQSARSGKEDIVEGMKAGAFYYLTKPFEEEMLRSIVRTALDDHQRFRQLHAAIAQTSRSFTLMNSGQFRIRSLSEANDLATSLANAFPNPGQTVLGLSELLINAIEHGTLGISYDEKSVLRDKGTWQSEIERRLELPENRHKYVAIGFERSESALLLTITDMGKGFDFEQYLDMQAERIFDNHGRGIAMSKAISFDKLEYFGNGNQVMVTVNTPDPGDPVSVSTAATG